MGLAVSSGSPETQPRWQAEITEQEIKEQARLPTGEPYKVVTDAAHFHAKHHLRLLCRAFQVAPPTASAASPTQIR